MKLAIYAITVSGAKQGAKLKRALPFADLFVAPVAVEEYPQAKLLSLPFSSFVSEHFHQYDGHIFICASGIVTRLIAPLIEDKRTDPAVVCVDEQAKFAISMLSGHRGGANELTERVAHIVKAVPVITTASDVAENVSADMLGARFGWVLDSISEPSITRVSASIVNDEPVLIAQEAGEQNWWQYDKRMSSNIICHTTLDDIDSQNYSGAIVISDCSRLPIEEWGNKLVLWRPKSLVLGVGCDRNTPLSTLEAGLKAFSERFNLSLDSVKAMASIDLKADEQGLIELSQQQQWPFTTFSADLLDGIEGIENPSDYVKKVTGSNSVAEAAALKLSGTKKLITAKWAFKKDGFNMTIACCRMEFTEPLIKHKRKNWLGEKKHGSETRHGIAVDTNAHPQQEIKVNLLGNEVVEGYQCKPKHADLDRPMLFHKHHLLICEGKRCAKEGSKNLAHDLRGILKELGLSSGRQRIKISRTMCAGACRNKATMAIYQRALPSKLPSHQRASDQSGDKAHQADSPPIDLVNHGIWLRGIEAFSEQEWRNLFNALALDEPLTELIDNQYFAPIEEAKE